MYYINGKFYFLYLFEYNKAHIFFFQKLEFLSLYADTVIVTVTVTINSLKN